MSYWEPDLTERMIDVLIELADGATDGQAAERLGLTVNQVREANRVMYRLLEVRGRRQAVQAGYEHGYLYGEPT